MKPVQGDPTPLKLPDGQKLNDTAPGVPGQKRRYKLYDKIKVPLRTMDIIIGIIVALLLLALLLGIILARA